MDGFYQNWQKVVIWRGSRAAAGGGAGGWEKRAITALLTILFPNLSSFFVTSAHGALRLDNPHETG
uniref:Uncharacterized protein n=1 Tax=Fundidesulfovibrio putealis TaxID=270496 RepID=A0A7C4AGZ2_9BACT